MRREPELEGRRGQYRPRGAGGGQRKRSEGEQSQEQNRGGMLR